MVGEDGGCRLPSRLSAVLTAAGYNQWIEAMARHGPPVAGNLPPIGCRVGVVDVCDPPSSFLIEMVDGLLRPPVLGGEGRVDVGKSEASILEDDRNGRHVGGYGRLDFRALEGGAYEDQGVDLAPGQDAYALGLLLRALARVQQQRDVALLLETAEDHVGALDVVLVADVAHEDAHHVALLAHKAPGALVDDEARLLEDGLDPLPGRLADSTASVYHPADRTRADAGLRRDVVYRHATSLALQLPLC